MTRLRGEAAGNKTKVKGFWQARPCGSMDTQFAEGSQEFFDDIERQRFEGDDFMRGAAGFDRWPGRTVLEVGCGVGTDLIQFARGGARVSAVDLTEKSAGLAARRLAMEGFDRRIVTADAEHLPFASDRFDLVYSWGVIHHTPDTEVAARELARVCKPGGSVLVMIYHRRSLFVLQAWLVYGLFRGKPFATPAQVLADHVESPGTKAYTVAEAAALLGSLENVTVEPIVTRFDVRIGRRRFAPAWIRRLIPSRWGWFLVVRGTKHLDSARGR